MLLSLSPDRDVVSWKHRNKADTCFMPAPLGPAKCKQEETGMPDSDLHDASWRWERLSIPFHDTNRNQEEAP